MLFHSKKTELTLFKPSKVRFWLSWNFVFLATLCVFCWTEFQSQAYALEWQGKVEIIDSVLHVFNPSDPQNEPKHLFPQELWRLDGNSEETVFGIITSADVDTAGNVYLFDYQLKEVDIVDLNGEITGRIGREGQGPGEYRWPGGLFVDSRGQVGVVQISPGKIVMLSQSGVPLGDLVLPDFGIPGLQKIRNAKASANRVFMTQLSRTSTESGVRETYNTLASLGENEFEYIAYEVKNHTRALNDAHYTEQSRKRSQPWVWTVGCEGRVYTNSEFSSYQINVYDVEGEPLHIIHREYESLLRPDWHFKELLDYYDEQMAGKTLRGIPMTFEVSRTDPDIGEMYARQDGSLWVLSSRGSFDKPKDVLGIFDVFDAEGYFDHQVFVHGEGDYFTDAFYIAQGLLVVIRNISVDMSKEWDEKDRKYEVICYRL